MQFHFNSHHEFETAVVKIGIWPSQGISAPAHAEEEQQELPERFYKSCIQNLANISTSSCPFPRSMDKIQSSKADVLNHTMNLI